MTRPIRIGLLAHQFLINIGANDFLKNLIRGLSFNPDCELVFLAPSRSDLVAEKAAGPIAKATRHTPALRKMLRSGFNLVRPVVNSAAPSPVSEYEFYLEACRDMRILRCEENVDSLTKLINEDVVDLVMPSIFPLPQHIPHMNYWPDCQPKHFPEFFDDESQRVRDERIISLLNSGQPLIINSRHAKQDMIRFYDANPEQVFELPFSPIVDFNYFYPRPELIAGQTLDTPFFLVSNQFWIHKNLETVFEAVHLAKTQGTPVRVYFTGKMDEPRSPDYIEQLLHLVERFDISEYVHFFGLIPKGSQIEIMKRAVAVIQPSKFEGGPGGGSVYDSTALGIRSIVSDIDINLELPVDGAFITTFRTGDAADLLAKMQNVLNTDFDSPCIEDLYQQSKVSTQRLSQRLFEAVDAAMNSKPATKALAS